MASVNSWFHFPKIQFSPLQLKLFNIELRWANKDAKHKKLLNILCIVYGEKSVAKGKLLHGEKPVYVN